MAIDVGLELAGIRDRTIADLHNRVVKMSAEPGLRISEADLQHLQNYVQSWQQFAMSITNSANPVYWESNLPKDIKEYWAAVKHSMRVLQLLYGPQPIPS